MGLFGRRNQNPALFVDNPDSILGFETDGDKTHPHWFRYLTVEGRREFVLGNGCGTCEFFFERLGSRDQSIPAPEISEYLNTGRAVDADLIATLSKVLPTGTYFPLIRVVEPRLVRREDANYIFCPAGATQDQKTDPAIDHIDPNTEYYRCTRTNNAFEEFLIPLIRLEALDRSAVIRYQDALRAGVQPSAVAISILDVKHPWYADKPGWSLAHYLLDGHHKVYAAASLPASIQLISFLAANECVASPAEIQTILQ